MNTLFATLIFLILVNNILLLAAFRLPSLIRLIAFQGICLAALLFCEQHLLLACAVLLIKGLLLPGLLLRTIKRLPINTDLRPRLHQGLGIVAGMTGLIFALWLETRLAIQPGLFPPLLLPAGLTTLFCGLILVVGRSTALAQVMGYLVAENGIFVLGIPLMSANTVWFELALLLDIFVAVFVMGIAINHIVETFESIDVDGFRSLRD
ncbi:MAG: hydrogenase-4 component E [Desulfovibrio sp.]|nr:hydrogenase-4 component E [Desulfovibrio sp.]